MLARLLKYLLGLLEKQPVSSPVQDDEPYDLFMPEELNIYRYWNGKEVVSVDPMHIHRKLMDVWPDLSVDMVVARSASKDASLAQSKMLDKIRKIFDVQPLEEGGLTETVTVKLFDHFIIFCQLLKKSMSPSLTSQTETSPPSTSSSGANQSTGTSSASGSTANESSTAAPPPLPTDAG